MIESNKTYKVSLLEMDEKTKKNRSSWIWIGLCILVALTVIFILYWVYSKIMELTEKSKDLENRIDDYDKKITALIKSTEETNTKIDKITDGNDKLTNSVDNISTTLLTLVETQKLANKNVGKSTEKCEEGQCKIKGGSSMRELKE